MEEKRKYKLVKLSEDRHQKLKILSAKTGKGMQDILEDMFDTYISKMEEEENK